MNPREKETIGLLEKVGELGIENDKLREINAELLKKLKELCRGVSLQNIREAEELIAKAEDNGSK